MAALPQALDHYRLLRRPGHGAWRKFTWPGGIARSMGGMNRSSGYVAGKSFPVVSSSVPLALMLAGMLSTFVLLDAVLPLQYLQFHDALLASIWRWSIQPTLQFFPGWALAISVPGLHTAKVTEPLWPLAWEETGILVGSILLVFLMYLLALRFLPARITQRSLFFSTLLLGLCCITFPVVTSSDVFSYIAYARLDVIYHQNPLTALPTLIHFDPVYPYVYWVKQPSAYGPVWAMITGELQMIVDTLGWKQIVAMVLALRLFGLAIHLASTMLIWSLSGYLMGANAVFLREKRLLLTLAFAWNPLLLFEACVNAHNDATVLLLVLLTLWLLARGQHAYAGIVPTAMLLQAAILFALATCLKLNMVILIPGFLLFVWSQPRRWRTLAGTALAYLGTVVLLYLPFWQNGAALNVLRVNPGTNHSDNSLAQFVARLMNSLSTLAGHRLSPAMNISLDLSVHMLSIGVFVVLFALLCGWAVVRWKGMHTLSGLVRWLALAWLLYCIVGSPWFWPWYTVTFFGLYALVEAASGSEPSTARQVDTGAAVRLMAFSMLSLYSFSTWPMMYSYVPGFPAFRWAYFAGLWLWLLPLLAVRRRGRHSQPMAHPSFVLWPGLERRQNPVS